MERFSDPDSQSDELQAVEGSGSHRISPPVVLGPMSSVPTLPFPQTPLREIALSGEQVPVNDHGSLETPQQNRATQESQQQATMGAPGSSDLLQMLVAMQQQMHMLGQTQQVLSMQMLKMQGQLDQQVQGAAKVPAGAASVPSTGAGASSQSAAPSASVGESQVGGGLKSVDAKLIPQMPVCQPDNWKSRPQEIIGFHTYLESITSWLSTLAPQ